MSVRAVNRLGGGSCNTLLVTGDSAGEGREKETSWVYVYQCR
jgi:hypothetical protein